MGGYGSTYANPPTYASPPSALDQSLVKRGVLVKLGLLGWFGVRQGETNSRRAHPASRDEYDNRVILHYYDVNTRSMNLPLESYSTDEDAGVGSWVLLEVQQEE